MPSTRLDTTIADLCREHGIHDSLVATMHCSFRDIDLHPDFPRESIYPEDEEPVPYSKDEDERTRLKKLVLGLKPLRRAWVLGNMDVILFKPANTEANIEHVLSQFPQSQRFRPSYIDLNAGDVQSKLQEVTEGRSLLYWRPQGWMLKHHCLVDTDISYEMNSKRFLISSGIPTPASEIVGLIDDVESSVLSSKGIPFVVKLCLASCGFGTFIITSEERRKDMVAAMAKYKDRGGKEVLVSAYIDWLHDLSVHFFVGARGDKNDIDNPLILGVTVQSLTEKGYWIGGTIDYSAQSELQTLLQDTLRETTQRLHPSFVGWAGVDIVIDRDGKQWVVDLNPRFTGSMPLCLLSEHFSQRLGLSFAQFGSFEYRRCIGEARDLLSAMIDSGQVVLVAYADIDDQLSMVDLVWGGRDREELNQLASLIQKTLMAT